MRPALLTILALLLAGCAGDPSPPPTPTSPAAPVSPTPPPMTTTSEHAAPTPAPDPTPATPSPTPSPTATPSPTPDPTPAPSPAPSPTPTPTPTPHAPPPQTIEIQGFTFVQGTRTVAVGSVVTWTNRDSAPHTATADDGSFDTGGLGMGASGSHTFTTAGTFPYKCAFHPSMRGTITVA